MSEDRASTTSRISPVREGDPMPDSVRAALEARTARAGLGQTPYVYGVLARHPALFERLLGAGLGKMPDALLPIDLRELLVLRTARNCGANYEWAHHVRQAPTTGLDEAQIELARDGAPPGASSPAAVLIVAADELHHTVGLSNETWQRLVAHFSEAQILEMLVLVGYYRLFAYLVNGCRLPLEAPMAAAFPGQWPVRGSDR